MIWNSDYQTAFDKIKNYLLNPSVLVLRYLDALFDVSSDSWNFYGCVLGQHDESRKKEQSHLLFE